MDIGMLWFDDDKKRSLIEQRKRQARISGWLDKE